jgi:ubiquitin-protein ligase
LLLGNKEASPEAIKKLQEEVENFKKLNCQALGFKAEPIKGNLFQWSVSFFDFNPHSKLGQELMEYTLRQIKSHELSQRNIKPLDILFELKFPFDYPNSPPLFR